MLTSKQWFLYSFAVAAVIAAAFWFFTGSPRAVSSLGEEFVSTGSRAEAERARDAAGSGSAAVDARAAPIPSIRANSADKDMLDGLILSEQLDSLMAKAKGEPAFAFALAMALNTCSGAKAAYQSLERNADQLGTQLDSTLAAYDKEFAKCKGLTAEDLESRYGLMEMSGRAGVFDAQIFYVDMVRGAIESGYALRRANAMDDLRANLEAFTSAAARTGDAEALFRAYSLYARGSLVPPDPVRAHGYLVQYGRSAPSDPNKAPYVQSQLAKLEAQMSPDQLRRARGN